MITVVGGNKGGSGKTTTASNLAIALAHEGQDVCLLNGDLQRTAAKHHAEREASGIEPTFTLIEKFDNLTQTLRALDEKYDHVIVDVAGRNSREFITSGVVAHQIIAPLQCSQPDLDTLTELAQQIEAMRDLNPELKVYCLQSMATTNPVLRGNERKEFLEYLEEFPTIETLQTVICFRKVYRDCMSNGTGVVETNNEAAKAEIMQLMKEVFA
ncbi:AAA family ATPase [Enterobacter hormaechei]|uniref:Chromosome partitioning protein ParA n=11 Tax=Enterobacter cloacae complex TaxID=354276 RepID=A0A2J0PRZ9_9ENTR|nr:MULTISPECIES: AAA family ATPase [Enterobacteriaceae]ASB76859.1 chromosome partitioning protein ParA [Enterobacter cloacae complex sp.]MEB0846362.1 AAA family ATPase [Citrobacter freundii]RYA69206.1 chromosome partitioning protein ParA [Enterobacter cloacae complex sp. 2DZ2F16B1]HDU4934217.1 AAA family ATPase [Klebsiella pneumoniae subsp. pneumoniae]AJB79341.1 chromosome partitioning protein ParA [Enterobacter hormaechei subsp. steigerwaltii]